VVGTGIRRFWRYAARLDVAAAIILIVVLVAAIGSCFPQLAPTIAGNPERLAAWVDGLRARHPMLADFLVSSGAVQFFHTPLFLIPWAALFLATLLCTLNRWPAVWRSVTEVPVRCADVVLDAAPYAARVQTPPDAPSMTVLRRALERQGFRVHGETVDGNLFLRTNRNWLAPLARPVTHLAVFLLLLGALLSIQFSWGEELTVAPGQAVAVGHDTGLAVGNAGFTIAQYPDGNIASYEADIVVQWIGPAAGVLPLSHRERGSGEEVHTRIRVNEPLIYRGVGFYLRGYVTGEDGTTLTLLAAYDPGYGVVIAGGFLLFFSMTVTFIFPACRVQGYIAADGTVRLGGWAERQAYGFEREFAALVTEVREMAANKAGGRAC
jgi:cytochrome c biogenesis protein ResB